MRWAYLFTLNWRLHWRSPQIPFRIAFLALLLGFILASLSLGDRLSQGIATHGKAWLGADVALQFRGELSATAWARAQQYAQSEALTLTPVSECFVTTSTSLSQPQTALLKAVDPSAYPLLGQLRLLPPLPLRTALLVGQVAVGADPLGQFNFQPGLAIQIAGQRFQAAANLESEPDALAGTASFALRILISRQDFTALRPHLDSPYCLERLLFRVPNAAQLNHHVEALSTLFPDAEVVDHRLPVSQGRMLLSATQRALQLSSYAAAAALFALLCSLLLLTQNRETLSFLAGLGARPRQLFSLLVLQQFVELAFSLPLAFVLGALLMGSFATPVGRLLGFVIQPELSPLALAISLLLALLALLSPAAVAFWRLQIRPAEQLRRLAPPHWMAAPHRGFSQLLKRSGLATLPRLSLLQLFRPGQSHRSLLISLLAFGAASALWLLLDGQIVRLVATAIPSSDAQLFVRDLSPAREPELIEAISRLAPGSRFHRVPVLYLQHQSSRLGRRTWASLCSETPVSTPLPVSLSASVAEQLGLGLGDAFPFDTGAGHFEGRVTAIRPNTTASPQLEDLWSAVSAPCAAFLAQEHSVQIAVSFPAQTDAQRLRQELLQNYPSLPIATREEFLRVITYLSHQATPSLRALIGSLSLLLLLCLLLQARQCIQRRSQELNLLRALGATPGQRRRLLVYEFATLAVIALSLGGATGACLYLGLRN